MTPPKFTCQNCGKEVIFSKEAGIQNRNHCPYCLHSIHLDLQKPGDRKSDCKGEMIPLGLTFKRTKPNKYRKEERGELMLVHQCQKCGKLSINRVAGDDNPQEILKVFRNSLKLSSKIKKELERANIQIAGEEDLAKIQIQIFGKL